MDLFSQAAAKDTRGTPLAERMRPRTLEEMVGQTKILGAGRALERLVQRGDIPSMILWGPPGTGKTTLARALAAKVDAEFEVLSATMSGVKEVREVVARAEERWKFNRRRTILFIDEIHRFNKAQQDALLPHVESGRLTLIGATTENPSFEVNSALMSRTRLFVLESLTKDELVGLLSRTLNDTERGLGGLGLTAEPRVLEAIAELAQGDARRSLGTLEVASDLAKQAGASELTVEHVQEAAQNKALIYDKAGEEHYNVISVFIKSMRGSDPDAAVYWMVRMLESGEQPRFILRRMVIFASEDIGNADPRALEVAVNALHAFELVGLPEGVLPMAQAVTYLASAPKSNASYAAYGKALEDVRQSGSLPVPLRFRSAKTGLMKSLGYGKDYKYPHEFEGGHVVETYLPDELAGRRYYEPTNHGAEKIIAERLANLRKKTQ